jgi:hypothetical protein
MAETLPSAILQQSAAVEVALTRSKVTTEPPVAVVVAAAPEPTSAPQEAWARLAKDTMAVVHGMIIQPGVLPAAAAVALADQVAPAGQTFQSPVMAESACK